MSSSSFIWDITNSNRPIVELRPPSPLCCLRFNPKSTDTIVGGCYNGLITYYDLRAKSSNNNNGSASHCNFGGERNQTCYNPSETSVIEKSHHDPVRDIFWISSKTGHQCASVSTDGQMLWWDTRKLDEPIDSIILQANSNVAGGDCTMTYGGSSLEYNSEAGAMKYLVGTEQGMVVSVNLRNRKLNNGISLYNNGNSGEEGKHHGPIVNVQRNPTHTKFFMTVGDWTARIWTEDLKSPIISTKYHSSYLTGGCWSPTRPGVFYVTRMDGVIDVWDYYHRQNEVAYSHKVGDAALSSISILGSSSNGGAAQQGSGSVSGGAGKYVAVGDVNGTVSLLEVCDSLAVQQTNEKVAIMNMFDRETKREKNLEQREKEMRRTKALEAENMKAREDATEATMDEKKVENQLRALEDEFYKMMKEAEGNEDELGEDYENDFERELNVSDEKA